MRYVPEGEEEPPQIRRLRRLSMVLMVVLIVGFLAMVGTIVIRLGFAGGGPIGAEALQVPPGEIIATGRGEGTVLFVVRQDGVESLVVLDADTGAPLSRTPIERSKP